MDASGFARRASRHAALRAKRTACAPVCPVDCISEGNGQCLVNRPSASTAEPACRSARHNRCLRGPLLPRLAPCSSRLTRHRLELSAERPLAEGTSTRPGSGHMIATSTTIKVRPSRRKPGVKGLVTPPLASATPCGVIVTTRLGRFAKRQVTSSCVDEAQARRISTTSSRGNGQMGTPLHR